METIITLIAFGLIAAVIMIYIQVRLCRRIKKWFAPFIVPAVLAVLTLSGIFINPNASMLSGWFAVFFIALFIGAPLALISLAAGIILAIKRRKR